MFNSKIDWCESTWNPVTGCLNGCEYCYARRIANRFGGNFTMSRCSEHGFLELYEKPENPYPDKFSPTFHRYRLNDYTNKKGRNIFVCSMADLFGDWVPDSWIDEVFTSCEKAPQHNYMFLTKYPGNIPRSSYIYNNVFNKHNYNYWFGTTITCQRDLENRLFPLLQVRGHTFLSIEPLLDKLDLDCIWVSEKNKEIMLSLPKKTAYYIGGGQPYHMPEWIIIGAETGLRKNKVTPKREWIEDIINKCRKANIPVFMKSNLADIWEKPLIQEYPCDIYKKLYISENKK